MRSISTKIVLLIFISFTLKIAIKRLKMIQILLSVIVVAILSDAIILVATETEYGLYGLSLDHCRKLFNQGDNSQGWRLTDCLTYVLQSDWLCHSCSWFRCAQMFA